MKYLFKLTVDATDAGRTQCASGETLFTIVAKQSDFNASSVVKQTTKCLSGCPFSYQVSKTLTIVDRDDSIVLPNLDDLVSRLVRETDYAWTKAPDLFRRNPRAALQASIWNAVSQWRAVVIDEKLESESFDVTD
jgi:hypothetical protein